ncbi:MAG: DUF11 domain-containing protein [Anaerolineae bacterium]|nr:DUF11 domain-containing protein [Anaerolineae bacterium]
MDHRRYLKRVALAVGLGIFAIMITMMGFSSSLAAQLTMIESGVADVFVAINAPAHIAAGDTFIANISYGNSGTADAPDTLLTATLPDGTQFVTATDKLGIPYPPDVVENMPAGSGVLLTWDIGTLISNTCWGHILLTLQSDATLSEGYILTTTAQITTTAVESDTTNNSAGAVTIISEMAGSAKHVHAGWVLPGDVLTYTIVLNPSHHFGGGINGRRVVMTDTLPFSRQVRFLGWHGALTGTQTTSHTLQWEGRLRAGTSLTLQYRLGVESTVTPGTVLTNVAKLGWAGRQLQLAPVTTEVVLKDNMLAVAGGQEGQLNHRHGVTLTVPPFAVTDTTRFQLRPLFTDTHPISTPLNWQFAHLAFELNAFRFGQEITRFERPLTLTVGISNTHYAGLQRETLRLWTRHGPGEPWIMLGEPARVMSGVLAFTTTHFSEFALFGQPTVTHAADLAVELFTPLHVAAGETFTANITYANFGTEAALGTVLTATLPTGVNFITATDTTGTAFPPTRVINNILSWDLGTIEAHNRRYHILLMLDVNETITEGTTLTTTASITTTASDSDHTNNDVIAVSWVSEMAGSAKYAHTRSVMPADIITYTIRVAYNGPTGTMGPWFILTDTLPFSHQVKFLGWGGIITGTEIDPHALRWQSQIKAGEPLTLQYRLGVRGNITPGTVLTNTAWLDWSGQQLRLGPVTTTVTLPHGGLGVEGHQGGEVHHQLGVTLTVPPDAVTDTTRFQIGRLFTDTRPLSVPFGLQFANRAFELTAFRFGQEVNHFGQPLTITVSITDIGSFERESLRLWTRHGPGEAWLMMGKPARVMSGTLAFTTTHFSQFALFGEATERVYLPLIIRSGK